MCGGWKGIMGESQTWRVTPNHCCVFEGLSAGQVWCSCFKTGTKRWLHGGRAMGGMVRVMPACLVGFYSNINVHQWANNACVLRGTYNPSLFIKYRDKINRWTARATAQKKCILRSFSFHCLSCKYTFILLLGSDIFSFSEHDQKSS